MGFFSNLLGILHSANNTIISEGGIYDSGRGREYSYDTTGQIPTSMGTYRFFERTASGNNILYIGVTVDLRRRVGEHKRKGEKLKPGEFVAIKIANQGTTWEQLINHEQMKITQHNPPRNKNSGKGGRVPVLDVDK